MKSQIDLIYSNMFIVHITDNGMSWGGFQADFDDTSASSLSSTGVQRQSGKAQIVTFLRG